MLDPVNGKRTTGGTAGEGIALACVRLLFGRGAMPVGKRVGKLSGCEKRTLGFLARGGMLVAPTFLDDDADEAGDGAADDDPRRKAATPPGGGGAGECR